MIFLHVVRLFLKIKKYSHKMLEKKFRGIVLLERDVVGKVKPKCDHDFSIPGRLKQKSATQF